MVRISDGVKSWELVISHFKCGRLCWWSGTQGLHLAHPALVVMLSQTKRLILPQLGVRRHNQQCGRINIITYSRKIIAKTFRKRKNWIHSLCDLYECDSTDGDNWQWMVPMHLVTRDKVTVARTSLKLQVQGGFTTRLHNGQGGEGAYK